MRSWDCSGPGTLGFLVSFCGTHTIGLEKQYVSPHKTFFANAVKITRLSTRFPQKMILLLCNGYSLFVKRIIQCLFLQLI